ncbi:MAG: hypothetical protein JNK77_09520 [Saprospiraceae bacterium]|nr:hypothetical protein [Saprospiraceae bacterium]
MIRGGSYFNNPLNCRPANRNNNSPDNRNNNIGLRLVLPFQLIGCRTAPLNRSCTRSRRLRIGTKRAPAF